MCAFDRIYYDALNGQLKKQGEKWEGIENTRNILGDIQDFCKTSKETWCQDIKSLPDNKLKEKLPDPSSEEFKNNIKKELNLIIFMTSINF